MGVRAAVITRGAPQRHENPSTPRPPSSGLKARSARIARPWRWVAHGGAGRTGGPARQRRPGPHDERDVMCATPCAPVRTRLSAQLRSGTIVAMETDDARVMAERLHMGDREDDGMPVIRHVRRVASRTPAEARSVAWLHEVLEFTAITEEKLLQEGLTGDELRALRLLHRTADTRSDRVYLAHLELIARAAGRSGNLARMVKIADLEDRCLHPRVRPDGWSPPYELGLQLLRPTTDERHWADAADTA
jgi:hypothetical protein